MQDDAWHSHLAILAMSKKEVVFKCFTVKQLHVDKLSSASAILTPACLDNLATQYVYSS